MSEVVGVVRSAKSVGSVLAAGAHAEVVPNLDELRLAQAFAGCRAVVHLAGISAERGGLTYAKVNVEGLSRVLEAARTANVPRVVFVSGLGVARYGQERRSTNAYFLAKLAAEVELFRSGLEAVALRPSYIIGPGDELIPALLHELAEGAVQIVGDGSYRLQPVAVKDAAEAILMAASQKVVGHTVLDLVGPEPLSYRAFVERVAAVARTLERPAEVSFQEIPVEEAERQAADGGYRGLMPDELDVLLCDETADPYPLERLLDRPLTSLDAAIAAAISGSQARPSGLFRHHE